MKKLIIHIGSHKTGTTSIQRSLYASSAELEQEGVCLFRKSVKGGLTKSGNAGAWFLFDAGSDKNFMSFKPGFAKALSSDCDTVIVSAESFSWFFDKNKLVKFKRQLDRYFDEIIIIAYIRRQDKHIVSHHQQGAQPSGRLARNFYGSSPVPIPEYQDKFDLYLDYNYRMGLWGDVFGDNNVYIRPFERNELVGGDVVSDFRFVSGIETQIPCLNENISLGFDLTKVGHLVFQSNLDYFAYSQVERGLSNEGKLLPARKDAEEFYKYYRDSNRLLNNRFGISSNRFIFDDDFSSYPEAAVSEWTEKTANEAILNILKSVVVEKRDIDTLKRVALKLKDDFPDEYLALCELINKFPG